MTTIVYRDGKMAADTRAYSGGNVPLGKKVKIRRRNDGWLFGASSAEPGQTDMAMNWFEASANPDAAPKIEKPSFKLLAVNPGGKAFLFIDSFASSGPLDAEFFAIGSGEAFAFGALHQGASAMQAVLIACQCDVWSDGPITVLSHDK